MQQNARWCAVIYKQGDDINKDATIYGKFANINTTNIARVVARGSGTGIVITPSSTDIPFTEVEDLKGAWDGSKFTVQQTGDLSISGSAFASLITAARIYARVSNPNVTSNYYIDANVGMSFSKKFEAVLPVVKGDVVSIRADAGITLSGLDPEQHWLHIKELPNTDSIIGNVLQDIEQYTEVEQIIGKWKGAPLYKRCFTVASNQASNTDLTSWSSGYKLKDRNKQQGDSYFIDGFNSAGGSTNGWAITYVPSTGKVKLSLTGSGYISAQDTSYCLKYTK